MRSISNQLPSRNIFHTHSSFSISKFVAKPLITLAILLNSAIKATFVKKSIKLFQQSTQTSRCPHHSLVQLTARHLIAVIYKFDPHLGQACPHRLQESPKRFNPGLTIEINTTILRVIVHKCKSTNTWSSFYKGIGYSRMINFNGDSRMDKCSKKCPSYKLIFFSVTLASLPLTLSINNNIF